VSSSASNLSSSQSSSFWGFFGYKGSATVGANSDSGSSDGEDDDHDDIDDGAYRNKNDDGNDGNDGNDDANNHSGGGGGGGGDGGGGDGCERTAAAVDAPLSVRARAVATVSSYFSAYATHIHPTLLQRRCIHAAVAASALSAQKPDSVRVRGSVAVKSLTLSLAGGTWCECSCDVHL
jgi:hypothetical protein